MSLKPKKRTNKKRPTTANSCRVLISLSRQRQSQGEKRHTAIGLRTAGQEYDLSLFFQSNKPASGEARQSGNSAVAAEVALSSR